MCGHEVTGAAALLHLPQPAIACPPGHRFRRVRPKLELAQFEREIVLFRQFSDRLPDCPTARLHPVVRVRNRETQAPLRRDLMHQIEQHERVPAPGNGHNRPTGFGEQARTREMGTEAIQQRSHVI